MINQIKRNLLSSNLNNRYIFIDDRTKFLYESRSKKNILGMTMVIKNKVVEIIDESRTQEGRIVLLKCEEEVVGWVDVDDNSFIRLFRLPKMNGKLKSNILTAECNDVNFHMYMDRIIKAFYYYEQNDQPYLLAGKMNGKELFPIKYEFFERLVYPKEPLNIHLKKGTPLFNSSNFQTKVNETKFDGQYQVVSYFNGTNEVRIEIDDKKYWVKSIKEMDFSSDFSFNLETLDTIDFITNLYEKNKYYEGQLKILTKTIEKISQNVIYNDNEDNFHIKKYLGESYDS